jgi:hypothetical protein
MIEQLKTVVDKLDHLQIAYMLSGSLAMGFYTIQRTTKDIDLVIELLEADAPKLVDSFQDAYYSYLPSVQEAIRYNSMFNFIDNHSGIKVDFILRKNSEYDFVAFDRRKLLQFENNEQLKFWVISLEDLIIAKLRWIQELQSERQMEDIEILLRNPTINQDYMMFWIQNLRLQTFRINFNK